MTSIFLRSVFGVTGLVFLVSCSSFVKAQPRPFRELSGESPFYGVILDNSTSMLDLAVIKEEKQYHLKPKIDIAKQVLSKWIYEEISKKGFFAISGLLKIKFKDVKKTIKEGMRYWDGDKEFVSYGPDEIGKVKEIREYSSDLLGPIPPEYIWARTDKDEIDNVLSKFTGEYHITPLGYTLYHIAKQLKHVHFHGMTEAPSELRMLVLSDGIDFFGADGFCDQVGKLAKENILSQDRISLQIIHYLPYEFDPKSKGSLREVDLDKANVLSEKQEVYLQELKRCLKPYEKWVRVDVIANTEKLKNIFEKELFKEGKAVSVEKTSMIGSEAYLFSREQKKNYISDLKLEDFKDGKSDDLLKKLAQKVSLKRFPNSENIFYLPSYDLFDAILNPVNPANRSLGFFDFRFESKEAFSLNQLFSVPIKGFEHHFDDIRQIRFKDSGHEGLWFQTYIRDWSRDLFLDMVTRSPVNITFPDDLRKIMQESTAFIDPITGSLVYIRGRKTFYFTVTPSINFTYEMDPRYQDPAVKRAAQGRVRYLYDLHSLDRIKRVGPVNLPDPYFSQDKWIVRSQACGYSGADRIEFLLEFSDDHRQVMLVFDLISSSWSDLPLPPQNEIEAFSKISWATYEAKDATDKMLIFFSEAPFDKITSYVRPRANDLVGYVGVIPETTPPIQGIALGMDGSSELIPVSVFLTEGRELTSDNLVFKSYFLFEYLENDHKYNPYVLLFFKDKSTGVVYYGIAERTYFHIRVQDHRLRLEGTR